MNKKVIRNFIIIAGVSSIATVGILKKAQDKNYLRARGLINKNTKILNVYTSDYFIQNLLMSKETLPLVDKRNREISTVYTTRAKNIVFDVCNENVEIKNNFDKEYKQILRFAAELNAVSKEAKLILYVVSNIEADKFKNLLEDVSIKKMGVNIEINSEFVEDIFEDE